MRILIASATAIAALSTPALASDDKCFDKGTLTYVDCPQAAAPAPAPAPYAYPVYSWTGFYLGAHAGYAEADFSGRYDVGGGVNPALVNFSDLDVEGFAYGGQIGYDYEVGAFVVGAEIDASYFGEDDTVSAPVLEVQSGTAEVNAFGSARLKLGLALDQFMPFVTAGVGLVDYEFEINDVTNNPGAQSFDETAVAAVIGGGLEYKVTQNIGLRVEGLYYIVDDQMQIDPAQLPDSDAADVDPEMEDLFTIRGAVNYRF